MFRCINPCEKILKKQWDDFSRTMKKYGGRYGQTYLSVQFIPSNVNYKILLSEIFFFNIYILGSSLYEYKMT